MQAYVGITDRDWFETLRRFPNLDEVNFWQPSGNRQFRAIRPGELFLFKLHRSYDRYDSVVGGGIFAYSSLLPISLAWEAFQEKNGAGNLIEMRKRVAKYRRQSEDIIDDYQIGCILLTQPFFLQEKNWIPIPDWDSNIVQGRRYDLSVEPGLSIWRRLHINKTSENELREDRVRFGEPVLITPRLGQGSFRVLVTDVYERRCAVTNEKTLPALDAAHIKPYSESGEHVIRNGILLRRDLHALFDQGYVTINPQMKFEVSHKIKEQFENGRDYYRLDGRQIWLPFNPSHRPSKEYLDWHNTNRFKA